MFTPLLVRLPCWLSQEEMQLVLEEYARAVVAAFGGVPPVQQLTILLTADGRPPALLLQLVRPASRPHRPTPTPTPTLTQSTRRANHSDNTRPNAHSDIHRTGTLRDK